MTKEQLIALIQKEVPDGAEVGVLVNRDGVVPDIGIGYVRATKPKAGTRWVSDRAKTGIFVLAPVDHVPRNFRGDEQTQGWIDVIKGTK